MANIRNIHKQKLLVHLQAINWQANIASLVTPAFYTNYVQSSFTDPYIYIMSGTRTRNSPTAGGLYDTGSYFDLFEYGIVLNLRIQDPNSSEPLRDTEIDEYACLLFDKLSTKRVKDDDPTLYTGDNASLAGEDSWQNLKIVSESETFTTPDPDETQNSIYKFLTIQIEQLIPLLNG